MSKKFSELPPKDSLDSADYIPIVDSADSDPETQNKIVTFDTVRGYFTEDLDEFLVTAQAQESARVSAENTRRSNETTRQSHETTRQSNEATREANEATRQANETTREDAETGYIQQAKSWAVGTNGVARQGDATDNAKYYAEQAGASATSASASATSASASATTAGTAKDSAQASAIQAAQSAQSVDAPELTRKILSAFPTNSASGELLTITDGADGIPAKKLTLSLSPHQSGSGDPTPDNVRAISGYNAVGVTRAGKNLMNIPETTLVMGVNRTLTVNLDRILPIYTYTLSVTVTANTATQLFGVRVSNYGTRSIAWIAFAAGETGRKSVTFTSDIPITRFYAYLSSSEVDGASVTFTDVQLEAGDTATAYKPYTGEEYDIAIPSEVGTLYGGTLTINDDGSGTLTVDMAAVDLGSLTWARYGNIFYTNTSPLFGSNGKAKVGGAITCPIYTIGTVDTQYPINNRIFVTNTQETPVLRTSDSRYTDVAGYKTAMSGMITVFELYEPQTYTLTASQVTTLLGDNTLWMDADGSIDLVYRADTQKYIDNRISALNSNLAYIEDGTTASRAYSVGQFVLIGGQLYKVTSAIASGATFTIGTNVTATTVGTELTALA